MQPRTVRSDNSTIVDGNYSTYNGMRVAFLNGSSEIKSFADFAGNKGFTYDPFYFDTTAEMEKALQSGNVDAIAATSMRKTNNERIVDKFDSSEFYVIVKSRRCSGITGCRNERTFVKADCDG